MEGIGLFLYEPTKDQKKEYIAEVLRQEFCMLDIETKQLNLEEENVFQKLSEIDVLFQSIPFDKKHFVFSMDGDGFFLTLKMDGLWVDNVTYNIFSYLNKHPSAYPQELSGINSWYISLLTTTEEGVHYIKENYPHLDGTKQLFFPAFRGQTKALAPSKREYDIFIINKHSPYAQEICSLKNCWKSKGYSVLTYDCNTHNFKEKLEFMGNSRITIFFHGSETEYADMEILSAMINGSVVITEETEEFGQSMNPEEELLFYIPEEFSVLPDTVISILANEEKLKRIAKAGEKKAEKLGNVTEFAKKILKLCK